MRGSVFLNVNGFVRLSGGFIEIFIVKIIAFQHPTVDGTACCLLFDRSGDRFRQKLLRRSFPVNHRSDFRNAVTYEVMNMTFARVINNFRLAAFDNCLNNCFVADIDKLAVLDRERLDNSIVFGLQREQPLPTPPSSLF